MANWNWKVVRLFIEKRFGHQLCRSSCLNYLHRLGFVLKRPKKRLLKADADKRAAFVAAYARLCVEAQLIGAKIFFVDEAHFRAEAELRATLARHPDHLLARLWLGKVLTDLGRADDGRVHLLTVLNGRPASRDDWLLIARRRIAVALPLADHRLGVMSDLVEQGRRLVAAGGQAERAVGRVATSL